MKENRYAKVSRKKGNIISVIFIITVKAILKGKAVTSVGPDDHTILKLKIFFKFCFCFANDNNCYYTQEGNNSQSSHRLTKN